MSVFGDGPVDLIELGEFNRADNRRSEPPLLRSEVLKELLATQLDDIRGKSLKNYEDQLDALFCAYLAYYFWYWGWERNELFGDVKTGYILNPKGESSK